MLEEFIPILLSKIQWKKSMYWGTFDLNWGRPLKSILAVFDKKKLNFNFHHLTSSNSTFIDKEFEDCLLYTSPSPRDYAASRMPSSA